MKELETKTTKSKYEAWKLFKTNTSGWCDFGDDIRRY